MEAVFRTCAQTGLKVHNQADRLIKVDAVAGVFSILFGGIAAIFVLLTYFVRYIDPEIDNASKKDDGFFSSMAFWRSKKEQTSPQLQIVVSGAGEKSRVSVTGVEGKPADDTQNRILNLLQKELK